MLSVTRFITFVILVVASQAALSKDSPASAVFFTTNETSPINDTKEREACGFKFEPKRRYFTFDQGTVSAVIEGQTAVDIIFKELCIGKITATQIAFEEDALVSINASLENISFSKNSLIKMTASVGFAYDWKKVTTEIELRMQINLPGTEIGRLALSTKVNGIDLIALQEKNVTTLNISNFLVAGISFLEVEFIDRGVIELVLAEQAKSIGKTTRSLRREAYTNLEQYRSLLDSKNETVIGETLRIFQDTITEGGGGKITMAAERGIKFLELLNDINVIDEFEIMTERIN